jgi:hypothetical protein
MLSFKLWAIQARYEDHQKPYYTPARPVSKEVSLMKRVVFNIAVILASITCSASAAAAPDNVFYRRLDRVPSFSEHFSQAAITFAWGELTTSRIVETQTMFIRHTATELQRRIAEQNAKAYLAHLGSEKKSALKKKNVHYLAVPTVRSKETSPKAKEVIMIWDIPRESLAGKNVYELDSAPPVGKLATYDNLVAEYVGKRPEGL